METFLNVPSGFVLIPGKSHNASDFKYSAVKFATLSDKSFLHPPAQAAVPGTMPMHYQHHLMQGYLPAV